MSRTTDAATDAATEPEPADPLNFDELVRAFLLANAVRGKALGRLIGHPSFDYSSLICDGQVISFGSTLNWAVVEDARVVL